MYTGWPLKLLQWKGLGDTTKRYCERSDEGPGLNENVRINMRALMFVSFPVWYLGSWYNCNWTGWATTTLVWTSSNEVCFLSSLSISCCVGTLVRGKICVGCHVTCHAPCHAPATHSWRMFKIHKDVLREFFTIIQCLFSFLEGLFIWYQRKVTLPQHWKRSQNGLFVFDLVVSLHFPPHPSTSLHFPPLGSRLSFVAVLTKSTFMCFAGQTKCTILSKRRYKRTQRKDPRLKSYLR